MPVQNPLQEGDELARQITSVHVDIARLSLEFSDISMESMEYKEKKDTYIADWVRSLVRSLVMRDPSLNKYGSFLMSEMEAYRKADSERKQGNKPAELIPRNLQLSMESMESSQSKVQESKVKKIKEEKDPLSASGQHQAIISYLNEKAGKHFRIGGPTQKLIEARMREGYSIEDFQKVIDNKVADWGRDSEMEKYLRPSTLFQASKMDGYLNQKSSGMAAVRKPFSAPALESESDLEFTHTGPA